VQGGYLAVLGFRPGDRSQDNGCLAVKGRRQQREAEITICRHPAAGDLTQRRRALVLHQDGVLIPREVGLRWLRSEE